MSWSLDANDLDLLAVQADERLLNDLSAGRHAALLPAGPGEATSILDTGERRGASTARHPGDGRGGNAPPRSDDPIAVLLAALARDVDERPIPAGDLATQASFGDRRRAGLPGGSGPAQRGGRRSGRRAAVTGLAAAAAMLSIGGVAAAVAGIPISSTIKDTVRSVFDGEHEPSKAEVIEAKLSDAAAALARGDTEKARQILEDIKAAVRRSDPGDVPPSLIVQIERLEARVETATEPPPAPLVNPSQPTLAPGPSNSHDAYLTPGQIHEQPNLTGQGDGGGDDQAGGHDDSTDEQSPVASPPSDQPGEHGDGTGEPSSDASLPSAAPDVPSGPPAGNPDGAPPTSEPAGSGSGSGAAAAPSGSPPASIDQADLDGPAEQLGADATTPPGSPSPPDRQAPGEVVDPPSGRYGLPWIM